MLATQTDGLKAWRLPRLDIFRPSSFSTAKFPSVLLPALCVVAVTFLLRWPDLGNPHVDFDEPFYLVVGDRILAGDLPYVDIWDRKPIGLFLIYAFARLFGGEGFVQYQLLASAFAAGTAWFIYLIARRWVSTLPAICSATVYVITLRVFFGGGGQSEVFYNLLTSCSAWLALRSLEERSHREVSRDALLVMILGGLALQIKYMVLPQCLFFGLFFLWRLFSFDRSVPGVVRNGLIFALLGIAPTVAVAAFYGALGQLDPFLQANVHSIFARGHLSPELMRWTKGYVLQSSLPLWCFAAGGLYYGWRSGMLPPREDLFVVGWLLASIAGFLMIGNIYVYYFLPIIIPLSLLAAPTLTPRVIGPIVFFVLFTWPALLSNFPGRAESLHRQQAMARLTADVHPFIQGNFVYSYDGPPAIYRMTGTRPPTRFVYPDHLNNAMESTAIGADSVAEVRRILEGRPGAILFADHPVVPKWNPGTERLVRSALAKDYIKTDSVCLDHRSIDVFVQRDAALNHPAEIQRQLRRAPEQSCCWAETHPNLKRKLKAQ